MLSNHHIDILKQLRDGTLVRQSLKNPDLEYLHSLGYISCIRYNDPEDTYVQPLLTEEGRAALDEEIRRRIRHWVPVITANVLSIAAIVMSIIALMQG